MHYGNLVIIEKPEDGDIDKAVERAMGPSEENGGFWDWYVIGGRWTGALDGYDPETDPANVETCDLCRGTGKRGDMAVANGCNGCSGKGTRTKWPTQWGRHAGDVAPIESVTEDAYKFYRIVTPYCSYASERYAPWDKDNLFQKIEQPPLEWLKQEYAGHLAVVVDNHN